MSEGRASNEHRPDESRFIEETGLQLEQSGLPRMAGRILGWLMISVPPEQSAADLALALNASKGSISSMTRLLLQGRLIERVSVPGKRSNYFRMKPNAWLAVSKGRMAEWDAFRKLADDGLRLMKDQPADVRERVEDFKEFCDFYERELPALFERWEKLHAERRAR